MTILVVARLLFSAVIMIIVWFRYDWFLALVLSGLTIGVETNFWVMAAMAARHHRKETQNQEYSLNVPMSRERRQMWTKDGHL